MSSHSILFLCSFLSCLFPCSSLLSVTFFSNWYMAGKKEIRSQKLLPLYNAIMMLVPLTRPSLPFFVVCLHAIFIIPCPMLKNSSTHLLDLFVPFHFHRWISMITLLIIGVTATATSSREAVLDPPDEETEKSQEDEEDDYYDGDDDVAFHCCCSCEELILV
jgi:hypothetical protein